MRMRGDYGRGQYYVVDITKLSDLNLTNEQVVKLKSLRENHLYEIQPLRDQMYGKSIELKGFWLTQHPDRNKIEILEKEIQIKQREMSDKVTIYRQKTLNILTTQQQRILGSYKEKRGYGRGIRGRGDMERPD